MGLSSKAIIGPVSLTSTATELHAVTVDGAVPVSVSYSATPTFNFNLGNLFKITLTGDAAPTFTNVGSASRRTMFLIAQDATGGRAFTWPAGWTNMPPVTRTASAVTAVEALFDGTNAYPVAPGSNLKLQVDDKTINAGFFAGASNALRVNAAIAYAAANSFTAVRVPANLLPYDASAVTFNTGVRMIREGGPTDRLDVEAYGAALDDNTDNFYAAQAMADAAAATNDVTGLKRMWFGNGRCRSSQPIWITGSGIQIEGTKQGIGTRFIGKQAGASAVVSTHQGGPTFLVCDSTVTTLGLVAPLVGAVGNGYNDTALAGAADRWWNLRDIRNLDINGLAAWCVEYFYQGTYSGGSGAVTLESSGTFAGTAHQGLRIYNLSGKAWCQAVISGVTKTVSDPAATISDGAVHHIRHNFDGSNLRTFVDGLLKATTAAAGTLTQHFAEEVYYGQNQFAMESGGLNDAVGGTVFSLRVSNISRETTNFTPPSAAHAVDGNTLIVLNHDLQRGPMTRAQTKDGDAWLVQRKRFPSGTGIYGLGLRGLTFDSTSNSSTAVHMYGNVEFWTAEDLNFAAVRRGLFGPDNANRFQWSGRHLHFWGASGNPMRTGIAPGLFGLAGHLNDVWFFGDVNIPLAIADGDLDLANVFVNTNTKTCVALWFQNANSSSAPLDLSNFNVNAESGVSASWVAPIVIRGSLGYGGISAHGCGIENGGTEWIVAEGPAPMTWSECVFIKTSGSPASVMKALGTFRQPAQFNACDLPNGWLPWSNVAGTASVGKLGKLTSIAFSTPLTLDCSLRDDFELAALTGAITINFSNVTPGQKISLWTVQNAGGGNAITFGTVNGTGSVKGATANDTTGLHYSQYLFDANLNGNLTQVGFSSGA